MDATGENTLPNIRAVITQHKPDGTSVFAADDKLTPFFPFGPKATSFSTFHSSPSVPVSNTAPLPETTDALPRVPPGGVIFCSADFAPNYTVPMHRTLSVDYTYVAAGEIVCVLDSGEEKTVKAGEVIVQRGTNHQWLNRSSEFARLIFVLVSAEEVTTADGKSLEETVIAKKS